MEVSSFNFSAGYIKAVSQHYNRAALLLTCDRRRRPPMRAVVGRIALLVYVKSARALSAWVELGHAVEERMVQLEGGHFRCEATLVAVVQAEETLENTRKYL